MPLFALGNSGTACSCYLRPSILFCVHHFYVPEQPPLKTVLNTLKYTKMTQNTERLPPIGDFLNEQVQQPTFEIKVKEKQLILCSHPSTFSLQENVMFYNTLSFSTLF